MENLNLPDSTDPLPLLGYSPHEISRALGICVSGLARDRVTGCYGGIPFIYVGTRVVYPKLSVEKWMENRVIRGCQDSPEATVENRKRGRPKGTTKEFIKSRADGVIGVSP